MKRGTVVSVAAAVLLAIVVAIQAMVSADERARWFIAQAGPPTVAPGTDVLAGISLAPNRIRGHDYHRTAFGDSWDDDNDAPGGHNGCDTRFLGGFGVLSETLRKVPFTPRTFR